MADTSQGEGWWLASDDKWYPPHLHADPLHRDAYASADIDADPAPGTVRTSSTLWDGEAATTFFGPGPVGRGDDPDTDPTHGAAHPGRAAGELDAADELETIAFAPSRANGRTIAIMAAVVLAIVAIPWLVGAVGGGDDGPSGDAAAESSARGDDPADGDTGASAGLPDGASDEEAVGTAARPAGFGEIHDWGDWRGGIIEVLDVVEAGLLADFADPPGAGRTFVAVVYESTYTGEALTSFGPFIVRAEGSAAYEPFGCFLDPSALEARGIAEIDAELVRGQTIRLADCFDVPTAEVAQLTFTVDNIQAIDNGLVYSATGDPLPDPGPVTATADPGTLELLQPGTSARWGDWSATLVEVVDAGADGLESAVSEPPGEGRRHLAVIYDVTHLGTTAPEVVPIDASVLGSEVFTASGCLLDPEVMLALGVTLEPTPSGDDPVRTAECVEVPENEVDSAIVRLQSLEAPGEAPAYYDAG